MSIRISILGILILHFILGQAQIKLSWDDLYDVSFEKKKDESLVPTFGESLLELDGEEVYLSGYLIPIDLANNTYVISAYPNASCFFCGGAGPESVMELQLVKANRNYRTDEWKRFKGRLCLNKDDSKHLHYLLEDAEEY